MRRSLGALALAIGLAAAAPAAAQSGSGPDAVRLDQNVPNPFSPGFSSTIIAYRTDRDGPVRLTIYNLLVQEVAVLVDRPQRRGSYVVTWDGLDAEGEPVPTGRYWYRLQVGEARPLLRQLLVLESAEPVPDPESR